MLSGEAPSAGKTLELQRIIHFYFKHWIRMHYHLLCFLAIKLRADFSLNFFCIWFLIKYSYSLIEEDILRNLWNMYIYRWISFFKDTRNLMVITFGKSEQYTLLYCLNFIYHVYLFFHNKKKKRKSKISRFCLKLFEVELSNDSLILLQEKEVTREKEEKRKKSHLKSTSQVCTISTRLQKKILLNG